MYAIQSGSTTVDLLEHSRDNLLPTPLSVRLYMPLRSCLSSMVSPDAMTVISLFSIATAGLHFTGNPSELTISEVFVFDSGVIMESGSLNRVTV
jgi:hypothetical protein